MTNKELFFLGAKHSIPICLGYLSVSIAYAVLAKASGYTGIETILLSILNYSGTGQFFAVTSAASHASLVAIAIGMAILNFRYLIMSTCVFARFDKLDNFRRGYFSHYITDEPFAIFTTAKQELISPAYFCGLFLTSHLSWLSGTCLGIVAHDILPQSLTQAMGIALYALFIAIIVPAGRANRTLLYIMVATACLNTVLTQYIDPCWSILFSIIVCSLIGARFTENKVEANHG